MSVTNRYRRALAAVIAALGWVGPSPDAVAGIARAWGEPAESSAESEAPPADAPAGEGRETKHRRFALVIGSNHTLDENQAPLRFADDDAARMAELLVETGTDTELVTLLDRDSQAVFPELVARAHRPDAAGLEKAFTALLSRMSAAKQRGDTVDLVVYYSGHGDVGPDGQGYLTLEGDKLTRAKLFGGLLARSPADHNHVIIDACRSEQFVLSRGKDWKPDRADVDLSRSVQEYLDKNHLGAFPNTGVLLAHSADQQTHEWDRYRGGIFTHELVSGLRGGADLNGDGRIEYSELGAFVSAANHGVDDPRARLEVVVRPPANDERSPVLEHEQLSKHRVLLFASGDQHHYVVEDGRGVRLVDLRRSGEQPGYLRLPDGELFIERRTKPDDRQEAQVRAEQRGLMFAGALHYADAPSSARGSLDQAFRRGLFATPFGPGYYHGYTARLGLLAISEPQWQGPSAEPPALVAEAEPEGPVAPAAKPTKPAEVDDDDDDEHSFTGRVTRHFDSPAWGGIFVGTVLTPFAPRGSLSSGTRRVTSNDMRACLGPAQASACSQVRGFDMRWQLFRINRDARFPSALVYFRTGYLAGRRDFTREGGALADDATELSYFAVPLYFGGNIYLFDKFPVRPFAGLGFGLDVMRLDYHRVGSRLVDTVARPGFEVHAGLEARITNYVSLTGEVRQQWSSRKKIDGVPDLSNEGVTFITGIAIGFPLRPPRR